MMDNTFINTQTCYGEELTSNDAAVFSHQAVTTGCYADIHEIAEVNDSIYMYYRHFKGMKALNIVIIYRSISYCVSIYSIFVYEDLPG